MASKRGAGSELTDRNWDQEEEPEEAGSFKQADDSAIKQRVIKTAKRRGTRFVVVVVVIVVTASLGPLEVGEVRRHKSMDIGRGNGVCYCYFSLTSLFLDD